jgi:hypothetical protein
VSDRAASDKYPIHSTAKPYYDQNENVVTLRRLIGLEPEWAHSRIKRCEELEAKLEKAKALLRESECPNKDADYGLCINGRILKRVYTGEGLIGFQMLGQGPCPHCTAVKEVLK